MPEDARKEILLSLWRDQAKMYGIDPMMVRIEKEEILGRKPNEELEVLQTKIRKLIVSPTNRKEKEDPQIIY
jgi:hypothetical protein